MKQQVTPQNNPSQKVLQFGSAIMTLDDMSASTFVSGGSGAGKTTGPLKCAITSIFRLGIAALISTAKVDDCERILQYAKQTGRMDDVIVVDSSGDYSMNFIQYCLDLTPEGSSRSISFTDIFKVIRETFSTISQQHGEIFWENEQDRLSGNVRVLIEAAGETVLAPLVMQVITSIPTSAEQLQNDQFLSSSKCIYLLDKLLQSENEDPEILMAIDYFMNEVPAMADRTWASIKSGVLGVNNHLVRGLFPRILGTETTNITPEMTYEENKIIILNTPSAKYGTQGTIIQSLFVYSFMQKMLQRDMQKNNNYVALICDEFQTILTNKFLQYVSMSRSSRSLNLFGTQSISACKVKIGGMQANDVLEAFIGNMRIKILMAHAEPNSNKYSSELIGQKMQNRKGYHIGTGGGNVSANASEFMKYLVEPHEFMTLKNGGEHNAFICEGYLTMTGRTFNHLPYMKVAFDQRSH